MRIRNESAAIEIKHPRPFENYKIPIGTTNVYRNSGIAMKCNIPSKVFSARQLLCLDYVNIPVVLLSMLTARVISHMFFKDFLKICNAYGPCGVDISQPRDLELSTRSTFGILRKLRYSRSTFVRRRAPGYSSERYHKNPRVLLEVRLNNIRFPKPASLEIPT